MKKHYGIICSPVPGHINPMSVIGRELIKRGHRVSLFSLPDLQEKVLSEGLEFIPIGRDLFPIGAWVAHWGKLARQTGLATVFGTIRLHAQVAKVCCDEIPAIVKEKKIEMLLIDQCQFQGAAVAKVSGVPFISINCAIPMNQDRSLAYPPPFAQWSYGHNPFFKLLNYLGRISFAISSYPIVRQGDLLLQKSGLRPLLHPEKTYSPLAQIIDLIPEVDFPREEKIENYFTVGPYLDQHRPPVLFPWDQLDGRPIVYASFGTLQNGIEKHYQTIMKTFEAFPQFQLVLSLGKWRNDMIDLHISRTKNSIVVPFAPQLEIIQKAAFVINHGGINSVLECLKYAKPMICIPITNDQPAMAARISYNHLGLTLPITQLTVTKLSKQIKKLLKDQSYQENVQKIAQIIARTGGQQAAADIIENKDSSK